MKIRHLIEQQAEEIAVLEQAIAARNEVLTLLQQVEAGEVDGQETVLLLHRREKEQSAAGHTYVGSIYLNAAFRLFDVIAEATGRR